MRGGRGCNPKSFALIGVVTDGALMRGAGQGVAL